MGQSLLVAYAYNNFDINFKQSVLTAAKTSDTLEHLTSGTLIQLEYGVKLDDLKCSEELWKKLRLNPKVDPQTLPPPCTCSDIELLHPEVEHPLGLMQCKRFNAWKFHYDLFHYGPQYFWQFIKDLGEPEAVEKIPVVKM